jgi:hypothetical protein
MFSHTQITTRYLKELRIGLGCSDKPKIHILSAVRKRRTVDPSNMPTPDMQHMFLFGAYPVKRTSDSRPVVNMDPRSRSTKSALGSS